MKPVTPIIYIRKTLLDLSQEDFASMVGVAQGTVSKWENEELEPNVKQLKRIRAEIRRRKIKWDDRWFFEAPRELDRAVSS